MPNPRLQIIAGRSRSPKTTKGHPQKAHKKRKCRLFVFCVGAELFNTMQKAKFSKATAGLNESGFYVTSCKQRTYTKSFCRKTCFILLCFPRICWWVCVFRGGLNTGGGARRLRFLVALDAGAIFFLEVEKFYLKIACDIEVFVV